MGYTTSQTKSVLGWLELVQNLIAIVVIFVSGYLCDHFKVNMLLIISTILCTLSFAIFLYDIWQGKGQKITILYFIGQVGCFIFVNANYVIQYYIMSKLCNIRTRATMFFFGGVIGSLAILFI